MEIKGIVTRKSPYSVQETMDRLVDKLKEKGTHIYARINQQSELDHVGIIIKPLECLLYGNPKAGGRIMQENPVAAVELPLRIIAWEGDDGKTSVAYKESTDIEQRYGISPALTRALDPDPVLTEALGKE